MLGPQRSWEGTLLFFPRCGHSLTLLPKVFSIRWGDDSSATTMQVRIYVDGRLVEQRAHQNKSTGRLDGVKDRPERRRPLEFSELILTGMLCSVPCTEQTNRQHDSQSAPDDESIASASLASNEKLQKLGTIELELRRVAYYRKKNKFYSLGEVPEIGPVHEQSKKAGVHAVS